MLSLESSKEYLVTSFELGILSCCMRWYSSCLTIWNIQVFKHFDLLILFFLLLKSNPLISLSWEGLHFNIQIKKYYSSRKSTFTRRMEEKITHKLYPKFIEHLELWKTYCLVTKRKLIICMFISIIKNNNCTCC